VIVESKTEILNEFRNQIETKGVGVYTSEKYVKWKRKQTGISPKFDGKNVDLWLTGKWSKSLQIGVTDTQFEIYTHDEKDKYLENRYGKQIHEISDETAKKLRPKLQKKLIQKLKSK
jgi:hypothetical protein